MEVGCSKNTFGSRSKLVVVGNVRAVLGDTLYLTHGHMYQNSQRYER